MTVNEISEVMLSKGDSVAVTGQMVRRNELTDGELIQKYGRRVTGLKVVSCGWLAGA